MQPSDAEGGTAWEGRQAATRTVPLDQDVLAHPGAAGTVGNGGIGPRGVVEARAARAAPAVAGLLQRAALVAQEAFGAVTQRGAGLCIGARRRIELKLGLPNTFLSAKSFYLRFKCDYLRLKFRFLCLKLWYLRFQVLSIRGLLMPIRKEPISFYYKRLSFIWNGYSNERVYKFTGHRRS